MIKVRDCVPSVYYDESRDFQYIGRLFEVIANYSKTVAEMSGKKILDSANEYSLLELASKTLGFNPSHKYDTKDLIALCNSFSHLMKIKGSMRCVEECLLLLMNTQNIDIEDVVMATKDSNDKHMIIVYLPIGIEDTILLEDLFNYILPTGTVFRLISNVLTSSSNKGTDAVVEETPPAVTLLTDYSLGQSTNIFTNGSSGDDDRPNVGTNAGTYTNGIFQDEFLDIYVEENVTVGGSGVLSDIDGLTYVVKVYTVNESTETVYPHELSRTLTEQNNVYSEKYTVKISPAGGSETLPSKVNVKYGKTQHSSTLTNVVIGNVIEN